MLGVGLQIGPKFCPTTRVVIISEETFCTVLSLVDPMGRVPYISGLAGLGWRGFPSVLRTIPFLHDLICSG